MAFAHDIYQRIVTAKMFMEANFHEPLQLEQIAGHACFSPYHFHRLFRTIYRKTPHQYLTQLRMQQARILLEKEGISVTDVCNHTGFESISSFSALFKRQNGYAPQFYRNLAYLKKKLSKEQPKKFIPHCFTETYHLDQE